MSPNCHPNCVIAAMNINLGVRTAAALLDQFYEKRRLLIISAPTAANHNYRFQMTNLQVRHDSQGDHELYMRQKKERGREEVMESNTLLCVLLLTNRAAVCFFLAQLPKWDKAARQIKKGAGVMNSKRRDDE